MLLTCFRKKQEFGWPTVDLLNNGGDAKLQQQLALTVHAIYADLKAAGYLQWPRVFFDASLAQVVSRAQVSGCSLCVFAFALLYRTPSSASGSKRSRSTRALSSQASQKPHTCAAVVFPCC